MSKRSPPFIFSPGELTKNPALKNGPGTDLGEESEEELETGYEIEDQGDGPAIPDAVRARLLAAWKLEE